ncbi:MAG: hypothetical protein ACP5D0_03235 [Hydrogenovibrio sp.]
MNALHMFPSHPNHTQSLQRENQRLKQELHAAKQAFAQLNAQYRALEDDFLHLLEKRQPIDLNGRKLAFIGAPPNLIKAYKAIVQHYHGELIVPNSDQIEAVCEAIQQADEVFCPNDCPNQALCHAARSSCTRFNKPLNVLESNAPHWLQEKLSCFKMEQTPS